MFPQQDVCIRNVGSEDEPTIMISFDAFQNNVGMLQHHSALWQCENSKTKRDCRVWIQVYNSQRCPMGVLDKISTLQYSRPSSTS